LTVFIKKGKVFITGKKIQPSLMSTNMTKVYSSGAFCGEIASPTNVRLKKWFKSCNLLYICRFFNSTLGW